MNTVTGWQARVTTCQGVIVWGEPSRTMGGAIRSAFQDDWTPGFEVTKITVYRDAVWLAPIGEVGAPERYAERVCLSSEVAS